MAQVCRAGASKDAGARRAGAPAVGLLSVTAAEPRRYRAGNATALAGRILSWEGIKRCDDKGQGHGGAVPCRRPLRRGAARQWASLADPVRASVNLISGAAQARLPEFVYIAFPSQKLIDRNVVELAYLFDGNPPAAHGANDAGLPPNRPARLTSAGHFWHGAECIRFVCGRGNVRAITGHVEHHPEIIRSPTHATEYLKFD
jgi:hypothetical protein